MGSIINYKMSEEMQENTVIESSDNNGSVKWFRNTLGYGFITYLDGEDQGKDVFVHHSGIQPSKSQYKTLQQGEYVTFSVTSGKNGPQAVQVKGIGGGPLMCDYWHDKKEQTVKKGYSKKDKSNINKKQGSDSEEQSQELSK